MTNSFYHLSTKIGELLYWTNFKEKFVL